MMTTADAIERLRDAGFEAKEDGSVLFVEVDNPSKISKTFDAVRKVLKAGGYNRSYGVRAIR